MNSTIDIPLTPPVNLRDLGGIPITNGVVRSGFAIRADDLSMITEGHARELVDQGLTTVIDLRTNNEVAITGRGPLAKQPVAYHQLSLITRLKAEMPDDEAFIIEHSAEGERYVRLYENAAPMIASALTIIALAPGTAAFHCAAGRDRTGVLAAAILLALGASDNDIITDYARTDANMPAIMERLRPTMQLLMKGLGRDHASLEKAPLPEEPMDVSMKILLTRLRERHGDALVPLRTAGLSEDTITRLRQRALRA